MEKKLKNLIFDVGGVLIGFRWRDMLTDYGFSDEQIEHFSSCIFADPFWKEFDLENLSFREVVEEYARRYPDLATDIRWFFEHAELMAVPRPAVWEELRLLKMAGYRLYLLSNYGSVLFEKHTKGAAFHQYLDGGVISWQIHAIKPHRAIYRELLSRYGLDPGECLFFDDLEENVEGARRAGIPARRVYSEEDLLSFLRALRQGNDSK